MVFVDGENLAIRFKEIADKKGLTLPVGPYYEPDVFVWMPGYQGTNIVVKPPGRGGKQMSAMRATYYTSVRGDDSKLSSVKVQLWQLGFHPEVFKRPDAQRKAKGVDIALTKDVLSHAYLGNYDVAVLYAGDGDYVPLVQEVKRLGKVVCVAFFDSPDSGLSQELKLSADIFSDIRPAFVDKWEDHLRKSQGETP